MPPLALLTFTFAALLAGLTVGVLLNRFALERRVDGEVAQLFAEVETLPTYYAERELEGLPEPVQRFFRRNLAEGVPHQSCVRLRHAGQMRQKPGQPWTEYAGETYTLASTPAMVWFARLRPFPLVWVDHRKLYLRERGHVLVKIFSSLTAVNRGDDLTRETTLTHYLAELPLVPTALLPSDQRSWEAIDESSARFVLREGELEVSGVFTFDEFGNVVRFESEGRPYTGEVRADATCWIVRYGEHRRFGAVELPTKIDMEWQLDEQSFHYVDQTISEVELDVPHRFQAD